MISSNDFSQGTEVYMTGPGSLVLEQGAASRKTGAMIAHFFVAKKSDARRSISRKNSVGLRGNAFNARLGIIWEVNGIIWERMGKLGKKLGMVGRRKGNHEIRETHEIQTGGTDTHRLNTEPICF
jgi:hypothetical protein